MHVYPKKPVPGDRIAIVSPSSGLPGLFPHPYELGLRRLREEFGLVPVEYPTTRRMGAAPRDRAADLHAAFADPTVTAVLASIGGDDQLTVLPHLDPGLLRANPKPFFGFSDNTNLHAYLWRLGIVSYAGGAVMTSLGRGGRVHPVTAAALRAALFDSGRHRLAEPREHSEIDRDWGDPATLDSAPPVEANAGWRWHVPGSAAPVEGVAWGGCLEVVAWLAMADRAMPAPEEVAGGVLYLETSEELPSAREVGRILRCLGERGLLGAFGAVLVGRPKAWSFERPLEPEDRVRYREAQRGAFLELLGRYNPGAPVVFDVDFGHTDPQVVIPSGGLVRVDPAARTVQVHL